MKLKKRQVIIALSILLVLTAGTIFATTMANPTSTVAYTEISRSELVHSIRVNGIVESIEKKEVYSNLGYKIKTVAVKVGDKVEAGQVLCQLDIDELELTIAQQKAELSVSQQNSLNQLQESKRPYNEAQSNLNGSGNSQVQNAESALKTAEINLQNAQTSYDNAYSDYENNKNAQILT